MYDMHGQKTKIKVCVKQGEKVANWYEAKKGIHDSRTTRVYVRADM